jgi:uncharacterized membrane protein
LSKENFKFVIKEKKFFYLIVILSVIALLTATYQTYTYYFEDSCGCTSEEATFELYSQIHGVPIAFIGMCGIGITLVLALFFLSPFASDFQLYFDKILFLWFLFQTGALIFIINLINIIYFIANTFCDLCLISQLVTIINWIIILRIWFKCH